MQDDDDKKRKDKHTQDRDLELLTIRKLMGSENGRAFMWRCLQHCNIFGNIYTKDVQDHAFSSGKRDHGLWLESEILEAAPDSYYLMLKENR